MMKRSFIQNLQINQKQALAINGKQVVHKRVSDSRLHMKDSTDFNFTEAAHEKRNCTRCA